ANQRLRGEGDFLGAPARFLGHYVVGRLALDLGIDVQLTPSPVTGVTARLTLPAHLLAETPPQLEAPEPPPALAARIENAAVQDVAVQVAVPALPPVRVKPTEVEYITVPAVPAQRIPEDLYTFQPAGDGAARTENGLKKRTPRARRAVPEPIAVAAHRRGDPAPPAVETPDDVRSRLTAFRRGVQRGTGDSPPHPPALEGAHHER
ncbi:sensor protein, partial [Actinoplanes sp. NPDC051633]